MYAIYKTIKREGIFQKGVFLLFLCTVNFKFRKIFLYVDSDTYKACSHFYQQISCETNLNCQIRV